MTNYDEQLDELRQQMASKNRLETVLRDLRRQQEKLQEEVDELEQEKLSQQSDVDRLKKHSLTNFFYHIAGKMEERLSREEQEAYAAELKYDVAMETLRELEKDVREKELEFGRVRRSDERYQAVLNAKMAAIKAAGIEETAELVELQDQIVKLENQERELREAISAGKSARSIVDQILSSLSSADSWSTWDMLGGGLIADLSKHSHLDDAQKQVGQLQTALRRFKAELADVKVQADLQVNIDGFLRFADYFFDGLFVDWTVKDKIHRSSSQVSDTGNQIDHVVNKLGGMLSEVQRKKAVHQQKSKELILKAKLD